MKFKSLFLSGAFAFIALLSSCSQSDEPNQVQGATGEKDMVEWIGEFNLPDNLRTRVAATGSVGEDGLYTFSREINRVWYAVYYQGSYLYDSEQSDTPDAIRKGDGFTVLFKFHKELDPTQIYIFFWAGNNEDNVTVSDATSSDAINLNFKNRCVSVNPVYMNGGNSALQEYDSFAGYFQLSPTKDVTNYNMKFTLKRPFAQIHILSDEFTFPGVSTYYPSGLTVVPGFGTSEASTSNYTSNLMSPTTWYFDSSIALTPSYRKNEFQYTLTNYEFTNTLSGSTPERVTFKNRKMDYLGCYYVFAPIEKSSLKYAVSSGNNSTLGKLNLAIRKKGDAIGTSQFASVDLPAEGIQANNRYVIYNHANTGDGDGGNGGGGFVTNNFAFEVVTAPSWDGTNEVSK